MSPATQILQHTQPFEMRRGGTLPGIELAYETWGELGAARDNAILLFTGLSPSAHAASSPLDPAPGWWEDMLGPGKPIDTDRFFVLCVNSLGSCFGSTGPASVRPDTGERYGLDFPLLSLEDVAAATDLVVRSLGIERLHTVAGSSMGGMTALAYAMAYPASVRQLVCISSAARAQPFAIALRSLQREIIRNDPAWQGGDYPPGKGPLRGMRLARKLGMITYRSAEEWKTRFGRETVPEPPAEPFGIRYQVESYLEAHAQKFTGNFDANCYLYLSRAMDLFDAAEHGESLSQAVGRVRAERALIIGVGSDILFPLEQQRELAELLDRPGCAVQFADLPSIQGHDSFLVDMGRFQPVVAEFLGTR